MPQDPPQARWGRTCPVCGKLRAAALPVQDGRYAQPPSLQVRVAARGPYPHGWEVRTLDGVHSWVSEPAGFFDPANDPEYRLCAVGHIFLVPPADRVPDVYNMCAAIGTVAGGKSYVLARMLGQDLEDACGGRQPEQVISTVSSWDALEGDPGAYLDDLYLEFQGGGTPILPTGAAGMNQLLPFNVLARGVAADLPVQLREKLPGIVVDRHPDVGRWGTYLRQPIVQTTDVGGRRTWNGFADLPGELFVPGGFEDRDLQRALRGYDSLLWVVDPVVTGAFNDWFADALTDETERAAVLNGSMRPSSTRAEGGLEGAQTQREYKQARLAAHLATVDNFFVRADGPGMRLLVTVNKADLLQLGATAQPLERLGGREEWIRGISYYLVRAVERFEAGALLVDEEVRDLFAEYLGADGDPDVREQRCDQLGAALLSCFSHPGRLWDLVERGLPVTVPVPGNERRLRSFPLEVPSLAAHLLVGLRPGNARRLLLRDLVMSAVGCGAVHALGLGAQVRKLLPRPDGVGDVLFFLCSPLGAVPIEQEGTEGKIRLRTGRGRFPQLTATSAALSQLRLAALWKARA